MNKIERLSLYGFYPVMFLVYFLLMFHININSFIGIPILLILAFSAIKLIHYEKGGIHSLITFFLVYNLASVILYLFNGRPIECYSLYVRQFAFPILFYYFGNNKTTDYDRYYKIFGISCLLCLGIGLILYITTPNFYVSYLNDARHSKWFDDSVFVDETNLMAYTRFSAFWATPYAVSYLGIPSLCFALLLSSKEKKNLWIWILLLVVSFISCILCLQRIAMAFALIIILLVPISGLIQSKRSLRIIIFVLAFGLLAAPYLLELFDERLYIIREQIIGRLEVFSFSQAMSEGRSSQYYQVFEEWNNPLLGLGLGSASGAALSYGFRGVTDGEYIRLLVESGVIGFGVFIVIAVKTVFTGIKYKRQVWAELFIVIYFLAASIGSNALSIMHLFAPMFWFCIGRIWNADYRNTIQKIGGVGKC